MSKSSSTLAADESTTDTVDPANQDAPEDTGAEKTERNRTGPEADSGRRLRRIRTAVLVVITVASVACAAFFAWKAHEVRSVNAAAAEALATAQEYAVTLTSVSPGELDSNFDAVLDGATGEFKEMYAQSSGELRQLLVDNNAQAEGTVVEAGIKSATTDRVEVLLFIDQTVTNSVVPEPRLDRSRVIMTLELVDGRWLASQVDLP
ncbi:Mce-associated membrane protein [Rhodococcus sp. SMB37]|uniref:hypothetical protein n=1 Tax=Rhodococcus sp. SMB37 TaxID=2512213 RepID=UPI000B27D06A|nr:hypothetical protein [Rhodococcus sp. SMB37]TCN51157.1 Mce-associated membrane protein [Rhodococcus sp. SMB37]